MDIKILIGACVFAVAMASEHGGPCASWRVNYQDPETEDDIYFTVNEHFSETPCGLEFEFDETKKSTEESGMKRHLFYNYIDQHWEFATEKAKCHKTSIRHKPWAILNSKESGQKGIEETTALWTIINSDQDCISGGDVKCPTEGTQIRLLFKCKSYIMGHGFEQVKKDYFNKLPEDILTIESQTPGKEKTGDKKKASDKKKGTKTKQEL